MFQGSRVRPVHRADNFTAMLILISQPYRPPRYAAGIALLYFTCLHILFILSAHPCSSSILLLCMHFATLSEHRFFIYPHSLACTPVLYLCALALSATCT
jgi:hypothetical protein